MKTYMMGILPRESNYIVRLFFGDRTKIEMRRRARALKKYFQDQHRIG